MCHGSVFSLQRAKRSVRRRPIPCPSTRLASRAATWTSLPHAGSGGSARPRLSSFRAAVGWSLPLAVTPGTKEW
jgi:hypothetical protein